MAAGHRIDGLCRASGVVADALFQDRGVPRTGGRGLEHRHAEGPGKDPPSETTTCRRTRTHADRTRHA